jgi:hypothetical protein
MGLTDLAKFTDRYRKINDAHEAELRRLRGSIPPSDPRVAVAPVILTPEREQEIAAILSTSVSVRTAASLAGVAAAELIAFAKAAVRP